MREFFHGWRRKTGVATLVMACVLCNGWVRSFYFLDEVHYYPSIAGDGISTAPGTIIWSGALTIPRPNALEWKAIDISSSKGQEALRLRTAYVDWIRNSPQAATRRSHVWIISYWLLTISLSLLSAYLILCKPRSKHKTFAQSAISNVNSN